LLDVPAILEGAARLSGEGLQELDVPVGEAPGFTSGDDDRSDGRALAKHRHREDAPPAASEGDLARDQWIGEHIFDLRHGTGDDGPTGNVVGWAGRGNIRRKMSSASGGALWWGMRCTRSPS